MVSVFIFAIWLSLLIPVWYTGLDLLHLQAF